MKTCMNCAFACVAANLEPCEYFKDASLFGKEVENDKEEQGLARTKEERTSCEE